MIILDKKRDLESAQLYKKFCSTLKDQVDLKKDGLILELLADAVIDYRYYKTLQDKIRAGEKVSLSLVQLVGTISSCVKRITSLSSQIGLSLKSRKQCGLQIQPEEDSELVKILKEE